MDATDRLRLARLEAELAALRKKVAAVGGVGVSTAAAGATHVRTTQLGFAAELTSAWSAATGYSWKRRKLDTTASPITLVNPGVQPTGDRAYPVSGSQTLTAGTPVWMEPSPDGAGYLFTAGTSADGPPVPPPAGATCAQPFGWGRTTCLLATVGPGYGWCANITGGGTARLVSADGVTWSSGGTAITVGGTDWTLAFDWPDGGVPRLVLAASGGGSGGASYTMKYGGCSGGVLVFGGASSLFCTDPVGTEECADQYFTISLYCVECYWECVDTDSDGNGVCLPTVVGPGLTAEACAAACTTGTGCNEEALIGLTSTMYVPADVTYFTGSADEFTLPAGVYSGTAWASGSPGVTVVTQYSINGRTVSVSCNIASPGSMTSAVNMPNTGNNGTLQGGGVSDHGPPVVMQFPGGTFTPDFTVIT